ncbi:MAG: anaerobic glycerol-3-phosphate dehydrogenase subunit C [Planctomycetota bacterium]|jgi:FAD/FMN-containing dehydrogenase/Fe-S oxidoreductase
MKKRDFLIDGKTKTAEAIGVDLAGLVKGDVHVDIYNRAAFSTDASIYRIVPQCVAAPKDTADIVAVVKYAADNQIPIAPRGAGSGLAGESLTSGIVLDLRRFMDSIIETADDGSWVRVQPGVVLDTLNQHLSKWSRKIGPDPSSGNRAVMGGVVANNATGAHSLQYGYISGHIQSVRAVLADGACVELTETVAAGPQSREGQLAEACLELLGDKQELIEKAQPATKRNRCGYSIQQIVSDSHLNLAKLMAGSEGTLAVFSEMTLRTVPVPKAKGLVQFEFSDFQTMARAVPLIVERGASACELMDHTLIMIARNAFPKYRSVLPAQCAATLLVEQTGDDSQKVQAKIDHTIKTVGSLATGHLEVLDENEQAFLWKARKDAVPLLNREKGPSHPIAFIEDISVDNSQLDKYVVGLESIAKKYDIPTAFYGHAGDGELHVRPYLDLSRPDQIQQMQQIAEEVFLLAWSLGGTISGEHGDGLLRSAFIKRQYGSQYYQLLRGIKRIFDPAGIFNPGKIINDDPDAMVQNLRAVQLKAAEDFQTKLCFQPNEFQYEAEQCNGCGVCLARTDGSRMCPIFRGLNEELDSSRAKANLLSAWMAGEFKELSRDDAKELKNILGLCVNCKMCSIECPAGVDISKIIIEGRAQLSRQTGFTAAELALSHNRWLSVFASTFAPLSNAVMALSITRWALEKTIGLDRTRRFPHFDHGSFIKKARRFLKQQTKLDNPADRVVYFVDSYGNYNDHELGFAVLDVLRELNIEVIVPNQRPVPLPAYVYGNLKTARQDIEYNLRELMPFVRKGYKVVCSEPSAALCLKDEMRMLVDTDDAQQVSEHTFELMDYLKTQLEYSSKTPGSNNPFLQKYADQTLAYHAPCHLKAMRLSGISIELLEKCGMVISDIQGGCCGLAGTAGMQKKHHDMSDAIGSLLHSKIDALAPDIILTECAACKMQIEHLTGKLVLHPIKLLAEAVKEKACDFD